MVLQQGLQNSVWFVLAASVILVPFCSMPEVNSSLTSDQDLIDFVVRGLGGLGWSVLLGVVIGVPGTFLIAMLNDELEL
jgi:hypothetical protein